MAPVKYWITRDKLDGRLEGVACLWRARPDRWRVAPHNPDVIWVPPDGRPDALLQRVSLEWCRRVFGVVPDTDRELIAAEFRDPVSKAAMKRRLEYGARAVG